MKSRDKRRRQKARKMKRADEPKPRTIRCRIVQADIDQSVCDAAREGESCTGCEHLT